MYFIHIIDKILDWFILNELSFLINSNLENISYDTREIIFAQSDKDFIHQVYQCNEISTLLQNYYTPINSISTMYINVPSLEICPLIQDQSSQISHGLE